MGLSGSTRTRRSALFLILVIAGISGARDNRLLAQQEPAPPQRWDGLIELISGFYQWTPPTVDPPIPADGPSEMSRHAINGDGRYILFNATAPNLGYSTTALYIRDRRTGETRVQLGGPALQAVISADGDHLAYKVCDPWMRQDQLPICDVYALDLRNWAWTLISQGLECQFPSSKLQIPRHCQRPKLQWQRRFWNLGVGECVGAWSLEVGI